MIRKILTVTVLGAALVCGACANTPANQADLTAAYNVAASAEAAYAAQPNADPAKVKQGAALLSSAQAALLAWENAPAGSTSEQVALSSAIAALVAFQAQIGAPHAALTCDPFDPTCIDGVHRGVTVAQARPPICPPGVHRGTPICPVTAAPPRRA